MFFAIFQVLNQLQNAEDGLLWAEDHEVMMGLYHTKRGNNIHKPVYVAVM